MLHDSPLLSPSALSSLQLLGTSLRHLAFQHGELVDGFDAASPGSQQQQQQHKQREQEHNQLQQPQQDDEENEACSAPSCLLYIARMSSLRTLSFTNVTRIPPSSLHHLSSLSLLTSLSLRAIATTPHTWHALEPSLLSLLPSLPSSLLSLDLRNGFPLNRPLLSSLTCLPTIRHFASHCTSGYQLSCIALNLPSLTSLSLSLNGITVSSPADLRQAVRRLSRLQALELNAGKSTDGKGMPGTEPSLVSRSPEMLLRI